MPPTAHDLGKGCPARGALPCPSAQVAGAESAWDSPRSRVSSRRPGESRLRPAATHREAATWNRPAGAVLGASQLHLHRGRAATPGTPDFLNTPGRCRQSRGAGARQVSRGPQHPAAHARPRTHLSAGTRGGGCGGCGGLGRKDGGLWHHPEDIKKVGIYIGRPNATSSNTSCFWRHGSRGPPPALKGAAGGWCPQAAAPPGRAVPGGPRAPVAPG